MMQTSDAGRAMIEGFEGLRLEAYQDVVGVWTIGYGHTAPDIGPGVVWTQEQCDQALSDRLANEFEPAVASVGDAAQGQFDAMVCLAYNIGAGAFRRSHVATYHQEHDFSNAADAFLMWTKAGGRELPPLRRRREAERQVYLGGAYPE